MSNRSSSSSSSSSNSYAGPTGAGGSSRSSATSPSGETSRSEESSFVAGATSASASSSAKASDQGATTSATVSVAAGEQEGSAAPTDDSKTHDSDEEPDIGGATPDADETSQTTLATTINLLLGSSDGSLLVNTPQRDIFWGGDGADIFQLSSLGVTELNDADLVLDYSRESGDFLALGEGIVPEALIFEVIDFSGDGQTDSTVLRSSVDNSILGIVLNTVDEFGETLLSFNDFTDPVAAESSTTAVPESKTTGGSSASSSSSAFVDGTGAGGNSSATATSPSGETSTSSDTAYIPGASSISSSASASADADAVDTQASVQGALGTGVPLAEGLPPAADILIGTPDNATLVGTDGQTLFVGHDGADRFVLSAIGRNSVEAADIVLGFSADQGDLIQLPETLSLSSIILETIDLSGNGSLDSTVIKSVETGEFYTVIFDTADSLGSTTLSSDHFVVSAFV
jgi:hypothetical protein